MIVAIIKIIIIEMDCEEQHIIRLKCFPLNVRKYDTCVYLFSSLPYLFMPHSIYALVRSRPSYRSHVNIS